jgi:hypothetical protein
MIGFDLICCAMICDDDDDDDGIKVQYDTNVFSL